MASSPPTSTSASSASDRRNWWQDGRIRALVSLLLIVHLAAVVLPPLSMEGSPLAGYGWRALRPYIEAGYLNHGYHFFAPQPGPSHLIRYELDLPDGGRQEGIFPSREQNWPRLLYHRHFMLTEFLNVLHDSAQREQELEQAQRQNAAAAPIQYYPPGTEPPEPESNLPSTADRELFDVYARSYADHLLKRYGAQRVTIHLVRHLIPFPEDIRAGRPLDDPQFYRELFQRTFEAETPQGEIVSPPPMASLVPVQGRAGRRR